MRYCVAIFVENRENVYKVFILDKTTQYSQMVNGETRQEFGGNKVPLEICELTKFALSLSDII